jgi:selenocysteine lyase/cysteine desulfurase
MTPNDFRALFPSAAKCIHLNHAGTAPIAAPIAEAVQVVCAELMSADSLTAYIHHNDRQEALRERLARMANVSPKTLAFVRNTSHAISIVAQAIPFQAGDSIVLPRMEYPANVYPWMGQEVRGATVRLVESRESGQVVEEDLMAACDASTRVMAVSWVQWTTGQKLDLQKLGTFCRAKGILLAVDIVQGFGALRIDLTNLPVDFAAFGCHKWLLAPGGIGGLYVREEVFPTLLPTNLGWNSVQNPMDWDNLHYDRLRDTPKRFEEGTPALLATAALLKSVELLETVGFERVEERVLALAQHTHRLLQDRGVIVVSPTVGERRSGIVAFRHPSLPHEEILEIWAKQRVVAAERGGNLRFSPHVYNTEEEIAEAVATIPTG